MPVERTADRLRSQEKTFKAWYAERYHAPSDDLSQPVDLAAAAQFDAILEKLALRRRRRRSTPGVETKELLPPVRPVAAIMIERFFYPRTSATAVKSSLLRCLRGKRKL
jgi:hypothetical protein